MKEKCPKCGGDLKVTKQIDNWPEVILLKRPALAAIFKQCFNCKYFFAQWFLKKIKEKEKE